MLCLCVCFSVCNEKQSCNKNPPTYSSKYKYQGSQHRSRSVPSEFIVSTPTTLLVFAKLLSKLFCWVYLFLGTFWFYCCCEWKKNFFWVSFQLLLVDKNIRAWIFSSYIWQMCWALSFVIILVNSLGFFGWLHCLWNFSISSFPNIMPFISFPCHITLQRTCGAMLNESSDIMVNAFGLPIFRSILKRNKSDDINKDTGCLPGQNKSVE